MEAGIYDFTYERRRNQRRKSSRREGIQVGRIQGAVRILKSMDIGREEIKYKIIKTFQLSEEEAEAYLKNNQ